MAKFENVSVQSYSGLVRDFVVQSGAKAMVRGLRAVTDFDYEFQLAGMNRRLMPDVETVFLTPGDQYQFISSKVPSFINPALATRLFTASGIAGALGSGGMSP